MSTLETNLIQPSTGTTLTVGASGDQITAPTGVKTSFLYPAFQASISGDQSLSDGVKAKIQFDTELFDTDSAYDNSTNYRFTPQVAGKYLVYGAVSLWQDDNTDLKLASILIYKNGSVVNKTYDSFLASYTRGSSQQLTVAVDMNGSSDYVEIYGEIQISSGASGLIAESSDGRTFFGAYRLGT